MRRTLIGVACGFAGLIGQAAAQSLAPMTAVTRTFANQAGFPLVISNPYDGDRRFGISVYDTHWNQEYDFTVTQQIVSLRPGAQRRVLLVLPLGDRTTRIARVCVTELPTSHRAVTTKGQVCGKYHLSRY